MDRQRGRETTGSRYVECVDETDIELNGKEHQKEKMIGNGTYDTEFIEMERGDSDCISVCIGKQSRVLASVDRKNKNKTIMFFFFFGSSNKRFLSSFSFGFLLLERGARA